MPASVMVRPRLAPVKALDEFTSVRENAAGREPVLVMVTVPLTTSPGLRLAGRLKIALPSLEFVWVRVPEVTEEMVLLVVEVKVAPEPTATAPATRTVARGTRTLRRLRVGGPGRWWSRGWSRVFSWVRSDRR